MAEKATKTYDLIGQQSYKEFVGDQSFLRLAKGEVREEGKLVLMKVDEATAKAVLALNGPGAFFGEVPA